MRVPPRRIAFTLLLIASVGAGAPGCNSPVSKGSVDGKELFATACVTCHGPEGTPPASMAAQLGVRDLRSAEFRARATIALVEHQVRTGSKNKLMPSFAGALSEAQITAIATFVVRNLAPPTGSAPPAAPPPPPTSK